MYIGASTVGASEASSDIDRQTGEAWQNLVMFVEEGLHQLIYISSNVIVCDGVDGEVYLEFIEGKLYSLQTSVENFASAVNHHKVGNV